MTKSSPGVFTASTGDRIQITVTSVNFDQNVQFDPALTVTSNTQFKKTGQLTMGSTRTIFTIDYNFPDPLPAGSKYTCTITGPGGFVDTSDISGLAGQPLLVVPYVLNVATTGAAAATVSTSGANAAAAATTRGTSA